MIQIPVVGTPPEQAREYDAGYDLVAINDYVVPVGSASLIGTGLSMAIPPGYAGLVCSRSGMALKHRIIVLNAPGIIDPQYRGQLGVILFNAGSENYMVSKGDKVAQLLITKVEHPEWEVVEHLTQTYRGTGGFGSTGA